MAAPAPAPTPTENTGLYTKAWHTVHGYSLPKPAPRVQLSLNTGHALACGYKPVQLDGTQLPFTISLEECCKYTSQF